MLEIYNQSLALLTDFYQLSMAYGYWKAGIAERRACFHMFFRRAPFGGGFTVACGAETLAQWIKGFRFDESDLTYLATLRTPAGGAYFEQGFLDFLRELRLTVTVHAVAEGTVVFPRQPLVRVEGPLLQCQLLESTLLNLINFPTLIATKAARVALAAQGDPILEFGLRRAQGIDGAITASRAAYIGGCSATSNVLAGKLFGIPVQGTHAHSWIMAFEEEEEAFRTYAKVLPDCCVFLVDTYDTIAGVKKAIRVGQWLKSQGKTMLGIRLDSGDLAQLSIESRRLLDEAGFKEAKIVASNELDETIIAELKRQGSKIAIWGVGTSLVTGKGQGALDGVYKIAALQDEAGRWQYTIKLSEQPAKVSDPGLLQVRRFTKGGLNVADVMYDELLGVPTPCRAVDAFDSTKELVFDVGLEYHDLLQPLFIDGKFVGETPSLAAVREHAQQELARFPVGVKRFLNPHTYSTGMEQQLYTLKHQLVTKLRRGHA